MNINILDVSKVVGAVVVIVSAASASWSTVTNYFAKELAVAKIERRGVMRDIDNYSKIRYHYEDVDEDNGPAVDLPGPQKRRYKLVVEEIDKLTEQKNDLDDKIKELE
jgi:hypothetical protein